MVGEIRDRETATIVIEAALTGHLLLTTLHAKDAPSAVMRLIDLGVEPFLLGSALGAVIAQRLARRLCPHCREEYETSPEELVAAGWETVLRGSGGLKDVTSATVATAAGSGSTSCCRSRVP